MFPQDIQASAAAVIQAALKAGVMIATAESCTGGLVSGALTAIAGSSAVLDRGFVTYSNEAKTELLGVSDDLLARFGAVSEPVARAMALGAVERSRASAAVSITGVAGPGGGSADKPVGLVHFAVVGPGGRVVHVERRFGDIGREAVRLESVRVGPGPAAGRGDGVSDPILVDARGHRCPVPSLRLRKAMEGLAPGAAPDPAGDRSDGADRRALSDGRSGRGRLRHRG